MSQLEFIFFSCLIFQRTLLVKAESTYTCISNQTKSNNTCDLNNVDPYRLQDTHTVALRGMQDAYEEVAKGLILGGAGCNLTGPIPMQEPNTWPALIGTAQDVRSGADEIIATTIADITA